jgi:ankyrin repeat protein
LSKEIRELLQKGLFEEEANRDLAKAAEAYSSLVAKYDQQRAWAATALFRLAEVRAKQGDKPAAIALHQRLLAEFPNHDPLAGLSRDRLAALGAAAPAPDQATGEPITEEEAKQLVRVREMAKNSPDLLNAVVKETGFTPLGTAAANGMMKVATFMLDHGADVEGGPHGIRPLLLAAQNGNKRMVELLLERKADVNLQKKSEGRSALQAACENGHVGVARLLLEWGADPNLPGSTPGMGDGGPLTSACWFGSVEIARMLLERGAKPDGLGSGQPPLHRAIESRNRAAALPLVALLIEQGANVNLADERGASPLHSAVRRGAIPIIALLLEHGAKVEVTDKRGATPLHMSFHEVVSVKSEVSPSTDERLVSEAVGVWDVFAKKPLTINAADHEGLTPLHHAMGSSLPAEKVLWLIERGGNLEPLTGKDAHPWTSPPGSGGCSSKSGSLSPSSLRSERFRHLSGCLGRKAPR